MAHFYSAIDRATQEERDGSRCKVVRVSDRLFNGNNLLARHQPFFGEDLVGRGKWAKVVDCQPGFRIEQDKQPNGQRTAGATTPERRNCSVPRHAQPQCVSS